MTMTVYAGAFFCAHMSLHLQPHLDGLDEGKSYI